METSPGFVADGCFNAESGIRAEVTAKYAAEMEKAGFWERQRIKREINLEVQRRMEKEAPPDALY